ncbi:MAG TPA: hypothetical protein VHT73_06575 [Thermodesulfobacteriota bacterium]|nr:hypothetical protein [Thermodesulfobacteriota bacterium]
MKIVAILEIHSHFLEFIGTYKHKTDPKGRNFDLYMINVDGTGLERITFHEDFDAFPIFSPDGKKLIVGSNRNSKTRGETNIFIADWVE